MLSKSRGSYVSVLQSPAVFTKTMVQGPTCLANVGAGAFSTWDAVHHTFPAIGRYWVLGVHKLLPQGPVGTECNLDGQGGQDPTNGLGQSTDVGESHRSTGHLVTWSTTSLPSTGRRAPCQDSMLHYCPDRASIWPNRIFVLLLLFIFPFLPLFSFIFIYLFISL